MTEDLTKTYVCRHCQVLFDPSEDWAHSTKYCTAQCSQAHLAALGFEPVSKEQREFNLLLAEAYLRSEP